MLGGVEEGCQGERGGRGADGGTRTLNLEPACDGSHEAPVGP